MDLRTEIESRNEEYKNASMLQKRVLLMEDVLLLLEANRIQAQPEHYMSRGHSATFAEILAQPLQCECCFLGATFVAHMMHTDPESASCYDSDNLAEVFDGLDRIEFEDVYMGHWSALFGNRGFCAMLWRRRNPDNRERMILLCQHIIENGGELDTDKLFGQKGETK